MPGMIKNDSFSKAPVGPISSTLHSSMPGRSQESIANVDSFLTASVTRLDSNWPWHGSLDNSLLGNSQELIIPGMAGFL